MPIYEYECPSCHYVFEEWVKLSDAHREEPCPKCGTSSQRVISHTSFVLKGEGWYVTDYGYRKNVHEEQASNQGANDKNADSKKIDSKDASTPKTTPKPAQKSHDSSQPETHDTPKTPASTKDT